MKKSSFNFSIIEQVAIALHCVGKTGCLIECFLGIIHINETFDLTLRRVIEKKMWP